MGIRESLGKHPRTTSSIAIVLTMAAVVYLIINLLGDSVGRGPRKVWFTDDGGMTWFADDAARKPPFMRNGKPAVMCFVYTCDGGKTKWVSHLLRYSPAARKQIEEAAKKLGLSEERIEPGSLPMEVAEASTGELQWVSTQDARAIAIMELRCPDGSRTNIIEVDPNE